MRVNEDCAKEVGVLEFKRAKIETFEGDSLTLDWTTLLQTYCGAIATVDIFCKESLDSATDVTKILPQDPTQWEDTINSVYTEADRFNRELAGPEVIIEVEWGMLESIDRCIPI